MPKACLIIHPGFSLKNHPSEDDSYGSYNTYWSNLKKLSEKSIDNQILVLEEGIDSPIKFNTDKIWRTKKSDSIFIRDYFTDTKKQGINELLLAGEWVYWLGEACLSGVAREAISKGFKINIVKDCVYPTAKPKVYNYFKEYSCRNGNFWGLFYLSSFNFVTKLYNNAINIQ